MQYEEFKRLVTSLPLISQSSIAGLVGDTQSLRNQLYRWEKRGLLARLRRGIYILNEVDRRIHPSRIFIANQLLAPSYVSCEYALWHYGMIPEKVEDVTSVTSKNTARFANIFGCFHYHHLKQELFFGFSHARDENDHPILIAEPEKALLDFIYLRGDRSWAGQGTVFGLSYRFQNLERLNQEKLLSYVRSYPRTYVSQTARHLAEYSGDGERWG